MVRSKIVHADLHFLTTIYRIHRQTLVVPAAIPGVVGGYPGNACGSGCGGWTARRVAAPLVGIRGGGVAAQFRAGDALCARSKTPTDYSVWTAAAATILLGVVALREHDAD
jgi:hypothetical protein